MDVDKKQKTARVVSRITTWIMRLSVVVTILFFAAVFVTANLGGNGDMQRQSLEVVLSKWFGRDAQIHKLNTYQLFPEWRVDFENMVAGVAGAREPDIILEKLVFVQDPLANMFGAYPIKYARFENFMTRPGVFGPKSLHLKTGQLEITGDQTATFTVTGDYGGHDVRIAVPVARNRDKYRIIGAEPIMFDFGRLTASGVMSIEKDRIIFDHVIIKTSVGDVTGTVVVPYVHTDARAIFKLKDMDTGQELSGKMIEFNTRVDIVLDKGETVQKGSALEYMKKSLSAFK